MPIAVVSNGIKEMPKDWHKVKSKLIFNKEYVKGLLRIEESKRLWIIFGFHRQRKSQLVVRPRKAIDDSKVGIFASRGIQRPNKLGLTLVKVIKAKGNILTVTGLDAFDGSPVFDVKPYDPDYDS